PQARVRVHTRPTGPLTRQFASGWTLVACSPNTSWAKHPSDGWAMLAITAVVVLANAPSLLAFSKTDPLGPRGALASRVTPGLLAGERALDPNGGSPSQALGRRC